MIVEPISRRLICISGFRQSAKYRSGSEKLRLELQQFNCLHTHVSVEDWNTDWEAYVSRIVRLGPRDVSCFDIRVFAYSWGVGYGFVQLAKYLAMEGIHVKGAVLCDGVYHPNYALRFLNWFGAFRAIDMTSNLSRKVFGEPVIEVPWNVDNVWWMRQTRDYVHGHKIVAAENSNTMIFQAPNLVCSHAAADDHQEYHRMAVEVAGRELVAN